MTKPCPVCGGPTLHAKPDGRLYELAHERFCTPALRSLVRAAERLADVMDGKRPPGMKHLVWQQVVSRTDDALWSAVRRWKKERAR